MYYFSPRRRTLYRLLAQQLHAEVGAAGWRHLSRVELSEAQYDLAGLGLAQASLYGNATLLHGTEENHVDMAVLDKNPVSRGHYQMRIHANMDNVPVLPRSDRDWSSPRIDATTFALLAATTGLRKGQGLMVYACNVGLGDYSDSVSSALDDEWVAAPNGFTRFGLEKDGQAFERVIADYAPDAPEVPVAWRSVGNQSHLSLDGPTAHHFHRRLDLATKLVSIAVKHDPTLLGSIVDDSDELSMLAVTIATLDQGGGGINLPQQTPGDWRRQGALHGLPSEHFNIIGARADGPTRSSVALFDRDGAVFQPSDAVLAAALRLGTAWDGRPVAAYVPDSAEVFHQLERHLGTSVLGFEGKPSFDTNSSENVHTLATRGKSITTVTGGHLVRPKSSVSTPRR